MASIIGVSSIYHQTPCELYKRAAAPITTTTATSSSSSSSSPCVSLAFPERQRPHFNSVLRARSLFATQAIATPNSVLSEEAFKGLGDFSKDSLDSESEYDSESEAAEPANEDELALSKLGLPKRLVDTLERRGISSLFPIQRAVLVPAMEGRDIIARAKTGTGKTLAFGIPILKRLTEDDEQKGSNRRSGYLPRVLVLAPTRELAKQVEKEIKESAPYLNTVCVYGGVSYITQQSALSRGVDVVVGTPGRLIDLINGGSLKLGEVQYLVLDEADRSHKFPYHV